jgi:hypothetical protein
VSKYDGWILVGMIAIMCSLHYLIKAVTKIDERLVKLEKERKNEQTP